MLLLTQTYLTLFVAAGIVLAGLLATSISRTLPERDSTVASETTSSAINYSILGPDANIAELERGRIYYGQLCAGCHGVRGDGSGEWAYRVTPRPRDLTSARVQNRSDGFLFSAISDGLIGTPMLGWKDQLSQRQRWQIVGYLRHLGAQAAAQTRIGT